ncbi:GTP-binding protein [Thiothrix lacustris]|uniref:ATP/GTP-binding protein n=1 Tax=Thiothrix lacustris TaxID=525917 RepID=A0ABY9MUZ8_9GAMM|nr:ATP/GTP-binding protein [Thiothrix lacustris]WML92387.1 ATP/GTP-binding protein [Thiothrix lacustris]WMP15684.1 ATP/GTP-binding protein [Thiothrix lacustris]
MSMINRKIIFTGPVGAGKTTAIASISDIKPIATDEYASDMTKSRKPQTTVAMDYGLIRLSENERVHLYGTPGQERFDFMWDILTKGGIGLILLLDNTRHDPFQDIRFYTNAFRDFIEKQQMVVGVTRMDLQRKPSLPEYRHYLESLSLQAPVFEVDARSNKDITMLLQALLFSLDPGVIS